MNQYIIIWITLPFWIGFSIYLKPKLDRVLALGVTLSSLIFSGVILVNASDISLQLMDQFGVTLVVDSLSGFFILTNALVTTAVILYCWQSQKSAFFFTQVSILHGSVNAVFICADLISLYVALEVISIAAFLLISNLRTNRSIWVGLRYLFVSNTAMLFYLIGTALVYQANHSFMFTGLQGAPPEAIALLSLGLLTKGGIFVSGLWLPLTHSESETPVSAMLSGVVVKAGVFPLVRCVQMMESLGPTLQLFSIGTAFLGVSYAIFEKDTKRMLAWSTISQLGFVMVAPATAGFYALTHGLAKASLFLLAGNLPSRKFQELRQTPLPILVWASLAIASLSISGFPLLAGYEAKVLTLKQLDSWQAIAMTTAAVGTAIVFAKFLFLPRIITTSHQAAEEATDVKGMKLGLKMALGVLFGGLIIANAFSIDGYALNTIVKSLITIGMGWLAYALIVRKRLLQLPRFLEQIEHLIGVMSLVLTFLFWMFVQ